MSEAKHVRMFEEDWKFVKELSEEKNIPASTLIKNIIHDTIKKIKIEEAIKRYIQDTATIRESAEIARISYREILNELGKRGLIGVSREQQERMVAETFEYFG